MTLENRLKRLEQRLGTRPVLSLAAITLAKLLTLEELEMLDGWMAQERHDSTQKKCGTSTGDSASSRNSDTPATWTIGELLDVVRKQE